MSDFYKFTAPDGIAYGPYADKEKVRAAILTYFKVEGIDFDTWSAQQTDDTLYSVDLMDTEFFKELNSSPDISYTPAEYYAMLEKGVGETVAATEPKKDFRQKLTDQIVEQLKSGKCAWAKPWDEGAAFMLTAPRNAITGRKYNGFNSLNLMSQQMYKGASDPRWITYAQVKKGGFAIPKDKIMNFMPVEYWQFDKEVKRKNPDTGKDEKITVKLDKPRVFYTNVYHASDVEGLPPYEPETRQEWEILARAEQILAASGADIRHGGESAYYSPSRDQIQLPPHEAFPDDGAYYEVALHELGHWTGHETRQNRDLTGGFGSESYAREELRAQLSSLFLSAELGIPYDTTRHAGYIGSWVKVLEQDKNEIFRAARDAEKIADFVMAFEPEGPAEQAEMAETLTAFKELSMQHAKDEIPVISPETWAATFDKLAKSHLLIDIGDTPFHDLERVKQEIEEGTEPYAAINGWAHYCDLELYAAGTTTPISRIGLAEQLAVEPKLQATPQLTVAELDASCAARAEAAVLAEKPLTAATVRGVGPATPADLAARQVAQPTPAKTATASHDLEPGLTPS